MNSNSQCFALSGWLEQEEPCEETEGEPQWGDAGPQEGPRVTEKQRDSPTAPLATGRLLEYSGKHTLHVYIHTRIHEDAHTHTRLHSGMYTHPPAHQHILNQGNTSI